MLENGVDSNRYYFDDSTALFKACRNGHLKIVKLLLAHKTNVDCVSDIGGGWERWTPLVWACSEGKSDLVRILLDNKANVNYQTGRRGTTPLFVACSKGHLNIVKMLLEKKASRSITRAAVYHNDGNEICIPKQTCHAMNEASGKGYTHIVEALRAQRSANKNLGSPVPFMALLLTTAVFVVYECSKSIDIKFLIG